MFAAAIRKRRIHHRSYSQWRWHLVEVFVRISGETHYLLRVVDHEGEVLEVFATKRRHRRAALKFLKRAMKRYGGAKSHRDGPTTFLRCRNESYWGRGSSALRSLAQQPGRKLTSALPATRTSNGEIQEFEIASEIRFDPRLDPQPLQPPTPSQSPRHFQTLSSRRPGRVASTHSLTTLSCRFCRSRPVSLTMPSRHLRARI